MLYLLIAMKEEHRSKLQEQLTTLIMRVLVNNPQLHYYQVCYNCQLSLIAYFAMLTNRVYYYSI